MEKVLAGAVGALGAALALGKSAEEAALAGSVAAALIIALQVGVAVIRAVASGRDPVLKAIEVSINPLEASDVIDVKQEKGPMQLVDPARPGKLQCYDPATMQHLGEVEMMTKARVDELVGKAREAQKKWAKSTFGERRAVLRAIRDYYLTHMDDIVRVCCRDTGKTRLCAALGEITPTCEKIRWMLEYGEDILRPETRGGQGLMTIHKKAVVEYEPLGVLGVMAPFNYVGHNLLNHIVSGLFSGNGVVCKVSEFSSWSVDFLVRPVRAALQEAGYSPELVQVLTGMAECGQALAEADVDKIIFTGSDRVGKLVMRAASQRLTPVVLELGGKDPFIVCKDVDLETVVPIALRGTFQNCGQNCIGIERIFVEEDVYDAFIGQALSAIKSMRQGIPLGSQTVDVGAMTMPTACDTIQALVDDAVAKGAKILAGGKRNAKLAPGQFFEPTLLVGVTPEMRIAQEEVFGPVMVVFRAWKDEETLLSEVNSSPYALGSSIFSGDRARAERIAKRTRAGMANINDFGINYLCQSLPFGGRGNSGFDKFAGPEGLRACCLVKSKTSDRIPGVHTSLPEPFKYPVSDESIQTAGHLVGLAYRPSWLGAAASAIGLVKTLVFVTKPRAAVSKKLD